MNIQTATSFASADRISDPQRVTLRPGGLPPFPPMTLPDGARATPELLKYVPQLSLAERDRRWDRARKRMLMAGLDALVFLGSDIYWDMGMANLRYLLQVGSKMGAFAIFPLVGEPIVWNAIPHMNQPTNLHLSTQEWTSDFRPLAGVKAVAAELADRGFARSRLGLIGFDSTIVTTPTLLHGDVVALQKALPEAAFAEAGWLLQEMRITKSEEEIGMLRRAGKIARKVVDCMIEFPRPGVTEAELYAEMVKTQIANGAEPNIFNLLSSGPVDHPPEELWHLLHGAEQPLTPTTRPLAEGDIVISEFHTKYGGYLCHTEFTVFLGRSAPQRLKDIFKVSVECLDVSREMLVPGKTLREAWEAIRAPADRAGLAYVELGFHAMGNASPEFPSVVYLPGFGANTLNGHAIGDLVLEEGMTFGNNIDLHDPAWKPDVGCMYSDFMVVRPGGAELLVGVPRELPQIG